MQNYFPQVPIRFTRELNDWLWWLTNVCDMSWSIAATSTPAILESGSQMRRREVRGRQPSCIIGPISSPRYCQIIGMSISMSSANSSVSCSLSNNNHQQHQTLASPVVSQTKTINIKLQHLLQSAKQQPSTTSNASISCSLPNNNHQQHQTPASPAVCQTITINIKCQHLLQSVKQQPSTTPNSSISCNLLNNHQPQ